MYSYTHLSIHVPTCHACHTTPFSLTTLFRLLLLAAYLLPPLPAAAYWCQEEQASPLFDWCFFAPAKNISRKKWNGFIIINYAFFYSNFQFLYFLFFYPLKKSMVMVECKYLPKGNLFLYLFFCLYYE